MSTDDTSIKIIFRPLALVHSQHGDRMTIQINTQKSMNV